MKKTIRETFLKADSKNSAYYKLITTEINDGFIIKKVSGCKGRVPHEETYYRESLVDAINLHTKKIKEKTNTRSKRKRVYYIVSDSDSEKLLLN